MCEIWEVVNDKIDGPLTWIKIGIPNKFVSNIQSLTSNINDIYYYSDGGSYIRLDLDKKYYAGEILDLKFSYTQARMYFLQNDECYYDYKPGWFDDIYVATAIVRWNAEGVIDSNCNNIVDGYYIYQTSLYSGQTITVNMKYKQDYFRVLNPNLQFSNEYMTFMDYFEIIIVILIIVIVITAVIKTTRSLYEGTWICWTRILLSSTLLW